ncbi:MAG TPA: RHS repeat-associated core domain-containing protein, partial [Chryseolinea sp.]|nr:RHS repeat-associated core domain-containing protein [Chryseolinea sp.]
MQLGNGRWETASYNNRLQVTQIGLGVTDATPNLLKLKYKYNTGSNADNNGGLREQKITVPNAGTDTGFTATQAYAYDDLNRLLSATETISSSQTWKQTFTYDRYGNRNFNTSGANTTTLPSSFNPDIYNPTISTSTNRFSSGQGYTYDANGAVTQDAAGQRFGYDAESRQKEFFEASNSGSSPDATSVYDGEGRRVKKVSATETTVFVYDASSKLVAEYSTALATTPQTSYLTADHLGSPRVITDQNGAVTGRKDYAAFGDETVTSQRTAGLSYNSLNVRQDYTGYQKEEGGLQYAQARFYNAMQGRFSSVDPLTASASIRNPQTFNRYSYVLNSPYKFTDPLGLTPAKKGNDNDDNPKKDAQRWSLFWSTVYGVEGNYRKDGSVISATSPSMTRSPSYTRRVVTQVIIWSKANVVKTGEVSSMLGHVSYIRRGHSYSWDDYHDEITGESEWNYDVDASDYTKDRSKTSAGTGYILDFGSDAINEKFWNTLYHAYDDGNGGQVEYSLTSDNCGHAFLRAMNKIAGDLKLPTREEGSIPFTPAQHGEYILSVLQPKGYVVQINSYSQSGATGAGRANRAVEAVGKKP